MESQRFGDLFRILEEMELEGGPKLSGGDVLNVMVPWLQIPYERKGQASEEIEQLDKLLKTFTKFYDAFSQLSNKTVRGMQQRSELVSLWTEDDDESNLIPVKYELRSYENLFEALATDLINQRRSAEMTKKRLWPVGDGRGELVLAKAVALDVAKVFQKLRSEIPKYGTGQTGGSPQGPSSCFPKVVFKVFKYFEMTADLRVPCDEAIAKLKQDS